MLIISYLCSITSFIMSLVKYCEPHVTYRQLIDLGNDVFDYDSSEVWKLKRQKDRDVINEEFLLSVKALRSLLTACMLDNIWSDIRSAIDDIDGDFNARF